MFSKSLNWMRQNLKSARFRYAAVLSFLVLIVVFGVVQASGPMRPPHPPGGPGPMQPPGGPHGGMGMWGQMYNAWYPTVPVPTIKILAVVQDGTVTFETSDFPENEDFTVTMGYMYTRGVNGIEVGTFNSGDGSALQLTFDIPEDLYGQYKISIRAQTDHTFPYYAFNWFYNNTTPVVAMPVTSADGTGEAAVTSETTEAAPAEEASSAADATASTELSGQIWQWVEFSDTVEGTQAIENPENYQVDFLPDGGMNIQADCNMGAGSYTAEEDGSITITVGAMTLALCQEGSRSDDFVNYLSAAAIYSIADGNLLIDLVADGGTMKFVVAGAAAAEESGTGGAEAPAEEAAEAPADPTGLTGVVWQWTEFTDPVDGMVPVDNPELYTAEFLTDGSVNVQADCNSGRGNYTADGSNIAISELAMTRALCMPDSLSDDFVNYLGEAAIYFFEETNLFLDLPADSGTMMFAPAEEAVSSEVTRKTAMKVAAQNGDTNLNSENVPSIEICVVVKDDSVTIVTADFPEDQEFAVKMGPLLTPLPMPYEHGPMPYEPMGKPMPYGQGQPMPYDQGQQMPSGQGMQMPSGQGSRCLPAKVSRCLPAKVSRCLPAKVSKCLPAKECKCPPAKECKCPPARERKCPPAQATRCPINKVR